MGMRRFQALVEALPLESALARATSKRAEVGWGATEDLLALNAELLDRAWLHSLQVAGVKQHNLPKPLRIPRPDDEPPKPKRKVTAKELAQFARTSGGTVKKSKRKE